MSNSLGVIRSSTSIGAVRALQPKMFLESEIVKNQRKSTETIVRIISANEISVPINKTLFTVAHVLLAALYIGFSAVIFYFGNLDLKPILYIETSRINATSSLVSGSSIDAFFNQILERKPVDFPITWLVGISFALCGISNLLSVSILRNYYFYQLTKCKSPIRWVEYYITSGINMSIISRTLGVDELLPLVTLSLLIATGTSFGYWTETIARPKSQDKWTLPYKTRMVPWLLGAVPMTSALILSVVYFFVSNISQHDVTGHLHAILWSQFLLFPAFGNVLAFQQWFTPKRYQRVELLYQVSSLITRSALGGLLFAFVLRNNTWEEQYV